MADVHDTATRSRNMAAVKGKDTKPEMIVRMLCHAMGFRYRLHRKDLPGKPDLVFPKYETVIFVHGCFWHKHSCPRGATPVTDKEKWALKQARNNERDATVKRALITDGWRVLTVWQCALVGPNKLPTDELRKRLHDGLVKSSPQVEELSSFG